MKKKSKLNTKVITVLMSSLLLLTFMSSASDKLTSLQAFEQLKSLKGTWQKQDSANSTFAISFELIANDSVLVETWLRKGKPHSLTLYHLDKTKVMATHYCPQGNQPRLVLTADSTITDLSFRYLDATNLESIENSHQHSLGFQFLGDAKVLRKESYLSNKGENADEMVLIRR